MMNGMPTFSFPRLQATIIPRLNVTVDDYCHAVAMLFKQRVHKLSPLGTIHVT